jgi:hypothetical protein
MSQGEYEGLRPVAILKTVELYYYIARVSLGLNTERMVLMVEASNSLYISTNE